MTDAPAPPFLTTLGVAIADDLVANGAVAYIASGSYKAAGPEVVRIYRDTSPEGTLEDSLTITIYADSFEHDAVIYVQFKIYTAELVTGDSIEQDLWNLYQERWGGKLGPVILTLAERQSGTGLGQDTAGRHGRSENYAFTVFRPTPNRAS
jgi:hypothetical protein